MARLWCTTVARMDCSRPSSGRWHLPPAESDVFTVTHHSTAGASALSVAALSAMWLAMMALMMAPTVWPWVRAFHRFGSRQGGSGSTASTLSFSSGYLAAWLALLGGSGDRAAAADAGRRARSSSRPHATGWRRHPHRGWRVPARAAQARVSRALSKSDQLLPRAVARMARPAASDWASDTGSTVSAAAGRSWPRCLPWASCTCGGWRR